MGSFIGIQVFPKAVSMLESGAVGLSNLITHRLSMEELPAGIAELAAGHGVKGVCFPGNRGRESDADFSDSAIADSGVGMESHFA